MVNINGLDVVNGENYPLDIWSLYMQSAVQKYPIKQFDTPSSDLHLEVKTDGRTYVKPEPPPEPPEEPAPSETQQAPGSDEEPSSQQSPASTSPPSASPEPNGG